VICLTELLFLQDSYLKECVATILKVENGTRTILNRTIFYPKGGGQPEDTGKILRNRESFNVLHVQKIAGDVIHEVDRGGLKVGDTIRCILDWKRRYKLMRSHTAAHVFASLLCSETGALVTGNQLEEDKIRFDFSLAEYDREVLLTFVDRANEILRKSIPVKWYELPRNEALKIPGVVKMAKAIPPNIPRLRLVEIEGVDIQADGGTHVRKLSEVGQIKLIKTKNKGKNNRRVYVSLTPTS
jgi:Ser-tRNA(Ala) deacylase AlaX